MPIGTTSEHEDLRRTVRRWLEAHCPPEVPRAAFDAPPDKLAEAFSEVAAQGWLGLHVDEAHGGEGFGLVELAVVAEELGRSLLPGPLLPTVVASAALSAAGGEEARRAALPGLADGSEPGGVHLGDGALSVEREEEGALVVSGDLSPVLGAPTARWLLVPVEGRGFCLLDTAEDPVSVTALEALDPTRPLGAVTVTGARVLPGRLLGDLTAEVVGDLALVVAAAEAAGAARWCLDTASDYAKVRVQFGRPIGQFQAIKHKLADMLVVVEEMEAVAWDAAVAWDGPSAPEEQATRSLAAAIAGSVALDGLADCAKDCVQILGGIGFTWEHDAHLYLRRGLATRQLLGTGGLPGPGPLADRVARLALDGVRRPLAADLPPEAEAVRAEIAPLVARVAALAGDEQREAWVEAGLLSPHWPRPWGRESSPLEQLVIDDELAAAGLFRPNIGVGAWALPTLIGHGTPAQQERWVRPTLLGRLWWCQLFSEPGAGSDLASLSTRAVRVDGGWVLNGQKVWTSMAQKSDFGICLARTDPTVPKHQGITYFVVDMHAEGVEVRPLRELTGAALFNEVFLTDVFVPDDCVVGAPGGGWAIARTTLANERVSMSSGATFGTGVEQVLRRLAKLGPAAPPGAATGVGALLAEAQALRLMGHRATLRSLSGTDPGPGASVRKLLGAEHEQRVQEFGLALAGARGAVLEEGSRRWADGFLATRCLTIAGGTSEVQRNVMAERILGQPRDPEPGS
jgi:alkylation response protein AidB-like acyl-CoA dehydrogenase